MGHSYQDDSAPITEINVTPLVDVVLVLLVIFMVTAPLIAARGIAVDSPEARTGEVIEGPLTLAITSEGELILSFDERKERFAARSRRDALSRLEEIHASNPQLRAIIAGDENVPHGAVMEVVDMVREAGMEKFALRTVTPR